MVLIESVITRLTGVKIIFFQKRTMEVGEKSFRVSFAAHTALKSEKNQKP